MSIKRDFSFSKVDDDRLLDYYKELLLERVELKKINDEEGLHYNKVQLNFTLFQMKERGILNATQSAS